MVVYILDILMRSRKRAKRIEGIRERWLRDGIAFCDIGSLNQKANLLKADRLLAGKLGDDISKLSQVIGG